MRTAEQCALRLNEHATAAEQAFVIRTGLAIASAVLGGAAGASGGLTSALSTDSALRSSGGVIAISGGLLSLLGSSVSLAIADPSGRLERRSRAQPYFYRAVEQATTLNAAADAAPGEVDVALRRRVRDELLRNLRICSEDGNESQFPRAPSLVLTPGR